MKIKESLGGFIHIDKLRKLWTTKGETINYCRSHLIELMLNAKLYTGIELVVNLGGRRTTADWPFNSIGKKCPEPLVLVPVAPSFSSYSAFLPTDFYPGFQVLEASNLLAAGLPPTIITFGGGEARNFSLLSLPLDARVAVSKVFLDFSIYPSPRVASWQYSRHPQPIPFRHEF